MLVAQKSSDDPTVVSIAPAMDMPNRLRRRVRHTRITHSFSRYRHSRPCGYELFSNDCSVYATDLLRQLPQCDVINLHWVAGFVDYHAFFSQSPKTVPIFWRLSDMNALTGGCHFDHGCGKHSSGCGACPQLGSNDASDLSSQIWHRKEATFKSLEPERLHFIALNRWMASLVERSPLYRRFEVTVVPNGVDTEVFAPRDRAAARDTLGIPQTASVVLFAADDVDNRRKGFAVLIDVLNRLPSLKSLFLLSVGRGPVSFETEIRSLHIGHVANRRLLSLVYSAADVYVVPSLQDNQPNTVLEAMACATPVIGFAVGGISEMVRPGITGELAPVADAAGLAEAILNLLSDSKRRAAMSAACRNLVIQEYQLEAQVRRYIELYERGLAVLGRQTRSAKA
jgi:glycosyltransferase involved in cell wall biosynthesis